MVRWAAFSCLLVPVVLVVYGASVGGAAAAALGLAAVTTVCRMLLRHAERGAAGAHARDRGAGPEGRHAGARDRHTGTAGTGRGRRARTAGGTRRGGRHSG
ncbi:hypothetical protein [Streptomyces sp. NPDC001985]|uniref:hypothetical protein n=1 Tax=Streptomyces sp. NPDC001985 TaxID=3154406 RepID=UPI00333055C8